MYWHFIDDWLIIVISCCPDVSYCTRMFPVMSLLIWIRWFMCWGAVSVLVNGSVMFVCWLIKTVSVFLFLTNMNIRWMKFICDCIFNIKHIMRATPCCLYEHTHTSCWSFQLVNFSPHKQLTATETNKLQTEISEERFRAAEICSVQSNAGLFSTSNLTEAPEQSRTLWSPTQDCVCVCVCVCVQLHVRLSIIKHMCCLTAGAFTHTRTHTHTHTHTHTQ